MRARKVKVDPGAPFGEAVDRLLAVRLDEVDSFASAAHDPDDSEALHDLRIAAKRVRYVLEVASPVVGDAKPQLRAAKKLQDLLGEIHDCDELLPLVERHTERLRREDAAAAAEGVALPHRRKYRGLEAVRAHTAARRVELHATFVKQWPKLRRGLEERRAMTA